MHETVGPQEGEDRVAFYLKVLSDKTGSLIAAAAQSGIIFSNGPAEFEQPLVTFGEKVGVAFQLLDDVIDLSDDPDETGKVPGTDLRAGVPTMPYLVLGQRTDAASVALRARIDEGVERIAARRRPRDPRRRARRAARARGDRRHPRPRPRVVERGGRRARAPSRRRGARGAHALRAGRRRSFQLTHRGRRARVEVVDAPRCGRRKDHMTKLRLAIVGAGPAGIYAADILLKAERKFDVSIDLFEQLPAPYGLVRYGVAPDHPRIKGIVTALREVLDRGDIRLFGNVRFGEDITLDDLKHHYHAVIFATGAIRDSDLDIPGIDAIGSYGAADFVSWFDGHPDVPREWPLDAASVAVIGNGNVALDVSRMLAKHADDLLPTEIPDNVYEGLRGQRRHRRARLRPPRPRAGEVHAARAARARRAARRRHGRLRRGLRLRRGVARPRSRATSRSW